MNFYILELLLLIVNNQESCTIHIHETEIRLLADKALFFPKESMLVVSDVHLGKATHFNKHGIGIPTEHENVDLGRLKELVNNTVPKSVLFLGDLFHSDHNTSWEKIENFIEQHPHITFRLILGNHDIMDAGRYRLLDVDVAYRIDNILLTHEPYEGAEDVFNIYGHIHPGVILRGKARKSIRMSCFFITRDHMVMPAFGSFTGLYALNPSADDTIYVTDGTFLMQVQ